MFKVVAYRRATGECPFNEFVTEMGTARKTERAKIQRSIDSLTERGFELLAIELLKKVEHDLYELRPKPYRVFVCWSHSHQTFFLLNGFRKKSQRLPKGELDQARRLRDELLGEAS